MFVHIGGDTAIRVKDIIGIFDISYEQVSRDTREFLSIAKQEGFIKEITDFKAKSFIITENDKKVVVYMSPISSLTLLKRIGFIRHVNQMM